MKRMEDISLDRGEQDALKEASEKMFNMLQVSWFLSYHNGGNQENRSGVRTTHNKEIAREALYDVE